ncbi:hypothetical protein NADFUDRAFT_4515, partial [Nadsonia fulvescens var. elongata DSM 6958]
MSFKKVSERARVFLQENTHRESWIWRQKSRALVFAAGVVGKIYLNVLYRKQVHGQDNLIDAIDQAKREKRGLITVMNHMSVVDDPMTWGILPLRHLKNPSTVRWGLAARDVCFSTEKSASFFSMGQVLPIDRFGAGPFQGAMDAAVHMLSPAVPYETMDVSGQNETIIPALDKCDGVADPQWIHVFPEGYVNQMLPPHENSMRYFHWGVGRLIAEPSRPPIVVPMFAHGYEKAMSELRSGTSKYLPQNLGSKIEISIGKPICQDKINSYRQEWVKLVHNDPNEDTKTFDEISERLRSGSEACQLRARIAAELREALAELRTNLGFRPEDPRLKDPVFWHEAKPDCGIGLIGKKW